MSPLGAFGALRNERLEQTLELITLTALSPRRVVIGKLLAQGVKLVALFAAMVPFVAMSFLLGGVDFGSILVSLAVLFLWSLWACALCLFLSTLLKSRAMSGVIFGGLALVAVVVFVFGRGVFFMFRYGAAGFFATPAGSESWWPLVVATSFCLVSMVNLVLLGDNRLSLPTENKVAPVRAGFLVQFLLIAGWLLAFVDDPAPVRATAVGALGVFGGLHLAIVAVFAVTEDLALSRRARSRLHVAGRWSWLAPVFQPGGGRGAAYVLVQMVLLVACAALFQPDAAKLRWLLAICAFICFFTGLPVLLFRLWKPASAASFKLRVALLVMLAVVLILPDAAYYLLWQPGTLDLGYAARHLINPFRTLANWSTVESSGWRPFVFILGVPGLVSYGSLIIMGLRTSADQQAAGPETSAAAAGEAGADVIY